MAKPLTDGTTGTGLDTIVSEILNNAGLGRSITAADIQGGAQAADDLNKMILAAIDAGKLFADGGIDIDDVKAINAYIRDASQKARYTAFEALHGDDEGGMEWGYHLVQNDGGNGYLEGRNLANTVFDGLYHIGFEIRTDGRLVNEDGNANATLGDVSHWLTYYLTEGKSYYFGTAMDDRVDGRELNDTLVLGDGDDRGYGNHGNDTLKGGAGDDSMDGGAGDDLLEGETGNDSLQGGDGNDRLIGGTGDDKLYGSYGNDTLLGGAGIDHLRGDAGRDRLVGGSGADTLYGGEQADTLRGNKDNDTLSGDEGDDRLFGDAGSDTLYGGTGDDRLAGGGGDDLLYSGYDNDRLFGGSGNDKLFGSYGNDRLFGGDHDDALYGEDGNDTLSGDQGADSLYGGYGRDTLLGGTGNDRLFGEDGNDTLSGGAGDDYLDGGAGDNRLIGGAGDDYFRANIGMDMFLFDRKGFGDDQIHDFNGADGDQIVLNTGIDYAIGINTANGTPRTQLTLTDADSGALLGTVTLTNSLFATSDIVVDPLAFA